MAENWTIRGEYASACNCRVSPCPCTTGGGDPTEGECNGFSFISIRDGNYGDVELAGLNAALVVRWQGNILNGNWDAGVLIDQRADDRQAEALQTIFTGQGGGTFADMVPLIGNVMGVERAELSYESSGDGESASVTADGTTYTYKPLKSLKGERTQLLHGALAFRDRMYPGKAEGRIERWDISTATNYGEWSDFEFSGP